MTVAVAVTKIFEADEIVARPAGKLLLEQVAEVAAETGVAAGVHLAETLYLTEDDVVVFWISTCTCTYGNDLFTTSNMMMKNQDPSKEKATGCACASVECECECE